MSDLSVPLGSSVVGVPQDYTNDVKVKSWVEELMQRGGYAIWSPHSERVQFVETWGQAKAAVQNAPIGATIVSIRDDKAYTYGKQDVGYSSAGTESTRHWVQQQVNEANNPKGEDGQSKTPTTSSETQGKIPSQEEEEEESGSDSGEEETEESKTTEKTVDTEYLDNYSGTDEDNDGYDDITGEGLGTESVPAELTVEDLDELF